MDGFDKLGSEMQISKYDRILGTLYGQAMGDAMGMPSELWPRSKIKAHFKWIETFLDGPVENPAACYFKAGQFTDDTAMALAVADAIIQGRGEVIAELIATKILNWAIANDAFNKNILGPSSKAALTAIQAGIDISVLENNGVTNGAAMRVSPLGCLLPIHSIDDFIDHIDVASSVTHKSDVALAGAAVIAWAISAAIEGHSWHVIKKEILNIASISQNKRITTFSASMEYRIQLALSVAQIDQSEEMRMEKIYNLIGTGINIIETVPSAIAMVEVANTDPNRCAILCANLGGDTDTIGAIATAICGALQGIDAIDNNLKCQLDYANNVDFNWYATQLLGYRNIREQRYGS